MNNFKPCKKHGLQPSIYVSLDEHDGEPYIVLHCPHAEWDEDAEGLPHEYYGWNGAWVGCKNHFSISSTESTPTDTLISSWNEVVDNEK